MGDQVDNVSADARPFYWACGKCRGRGLYRDDDRLVGDYSIACPTCGNRYYGDVGGKAQGAAPVKVYFTPKPLPPPGPSHFTTERTGNILTGPGRIRRREKEEFMGRRAPCRNCDRELTIVNDGCCFVCYKAGKGLEGEEKEASLAAVKAKIENGGLRRCGHHGGARKAAPKNPAAEMTGSAEQAGVKQKRKYSRKEGPCFNCGRVMQIQARDACCLCYPALKLGDSDESRERKLRGIRLKLGVKEFAENREMPVAPNALNSGLPQLPMREKIVIPKPPADIMRDVHGCLSVIILSAEEMGFIEALRAGRIAIIS